MPTETKRWYVYLVRCNNGHIYTGISTDVERRLAEHQSGKGAKYLRGKGPLQLLLQKEIGSHSEALKIEAVVKKLAKVDKEKLVLTNGAGLSLL